MKKDKIKVLYVDDEPQNLISFKANFRKFFQIYIAHSPLEGLQILKTNGIHVIIADQRMPEQTGVDFLETISNQYPSTMRILLTGYQDIDVTINAINKSQVYKYLTKPWNTEDLKKTIEEAYRVYQFGNQKNQAANNFVYKVSHDLKAPLSSIENLVNSAKEEIGQENALRYIDLIGSRVEHLDKLLKELAEYVTNGHGVRNYSTISFKQLVEEVLLSLDNSDIFKNVKIHINIFQKTTFMSDNGILRSVIQNLILNAIKFKNPDVNNAFVSIDIISSGKEGIIEIEDNGIGMPENVIKNIFKIFTKPNKKNKGTGIGMYIVKTGLEKINGNIHVQSAPKEGTVFTIRIPNYNYAPVS
jgi:two-component system sensor histidine kinase/response regulator